MVLLEDIKDKVVSKSPFSLSTDVSTISSENYCAFQVKYLDLNDIDEPLKYRTIGLASGFLTTSGENLYSLAEEKLFTMKILSRI